MSLNDRSAVAVLTGMVNKIASALYIFGYRISTVLSRVSKITVSFSPTARLHTTTHLSSSICRDSCDSAGRSKFSSNIVAIFAGISCNSDDTKRNCAEYRHGPTEGKITPVSSTDGEFLLEHCSCCVGAWPAGVHTHVIPHVLPFPLPFSTDHKWYLMRWAEPMFSEGVQCQDSVFSICHPALYCGLRRVLLHDHPVLHQFH